MTKSLHNQTAIISGGLGDIGRAVALELARRGANIAISDVRPSSNANEFLESVRALGVRARYDNVDVASSSEVSTWIQNVEADLGVASLVIPNAAIVTLKGVRTVTPDEWSRELSINLTGAFHMAQSAAMRLLEQKKPGRIVFIGSWAAHAPHPNITTYCVAKAGLRMLCKCMALDLAPAGILVNEVAPGYVNAGLSAQLWAKTPGSREKAAERVPTKQLIEPDEVALQVAHLCEPANRHTTGSVVLMDGGLSLVTPANK
jgi:NAD(P)-dependent dehydrogenase (short-subunit alcohol dehydrogenase family)